MRPPADLTLLLFALEAFRADDTASLADAWARQISREEAASAARAGAGACDASVDVPSEVN